MDSTSSVRTVQLKPIDATPASFSDFGQVILPSDGKKFGPGDAQLDLSRGTPRFYILRIEGCRPEFSKITQHVRVTQCLGAAGGGEWFLGVAKATAPGGEPPGPEDVRVFRVEGTKYLKLELGTWHAGPMFRADAMDFFNLELSDTNEVDRTTIDLRKKHGIVFLIEE